ncbi:hypothetical protein ACIQOV_08850 [Kitasatospora sp. NPDC091257]
MRRAHISARVDAALAGEELSDGFLPGLPDGPLPERQQPDGSAP